MSDVTKTFFTALAAVVSAAVIAIWLADRADGVHRVTVPDHWASSQTVPGPQAEQASKPRG
jgi:predicted component of type VI protein secretion system